MSKGIVPRASLDSVHCTVKGMILYILFGLGKRLTILGSLLSTLQ